MAHASRFQKADMLADAVSNIWVAAIDFFRIFPGGAVYPSSFQPRWYPHFSGVRFGCDCL